MTQRQRDSAAAAELLREENAVRAQRAPDPGLDVYDKIGRRGAEQAGSQRQSLERLAQPQYAIPQISSDSMIRANRERLERTRREAMDPAKRP